MKIVLEVIEGPYQGKVFHFTEPDCFLVGRDGKDCRAHFRLDPRLDMYMSRNHFFLEVKPPNCYIRDNQSTNGTYVKRAGSSHFERITFTQLQAGDLIKAGHTIFKISFVKEEKDERGLSFHCLRCGAEIDIFVSGDEFLCLTCREALRRKEKKKASRFFCLHCGAEVTSCAKSDGRAEELAGVVDYVCRNCVHTLQEKLPSGTPSQLGKYVVLKELGKGGMGVVYKVWDERTGRLLALKRMLPNGFNDEKGRKIFQREMSITSSLIHKNIVRFIEGNTDGRESYFVMEYVKDGCCDGLFRKEYPEGFPVKLACDIICQALDGLEYAHTHPRRFIHRDIKPNNILLRRESRKIIAKVSDFGLAKGIDDSGGTIIGGECAGTLIYMCPQQFTDYKNPKPHFDTYSIGISLYEMLSGDFPFESPKNIMEAILHEPPVPLLRKAPHIPRKIAQVVDKSIQKEPEKRFLSAREFKEALLEAMKEV